MFVAGHGTDDGRMVFSLAAGFGSLAVNMETFSEGIVPVSSLLHIVFSC